MGLYAILFGNAILVLAVERVVNAFSDERRTFFPITVLSYVFVWVGLWLHFSWANPIATTLIVYIALLTVTINYKSSLTRRLAALAGSHLIMNGATAIFQAFAFFVPALSAYIVELDFMLAMVIAYLIAFMMCRYFKNIKTYAQNLHKLLIPFLFVPITQLFVVIFMHINLEVAGMTQAISNSLGVVFLFFYLYYSISKSFKKDMKLALHIQEGEYYFTQCQLMQESVDKMKAYRHDIKLHLGALRDFTINNKVDEANVYLNNLIGSIGNSESFSETGNVAFDSIINFKLKDVLDDNINLQIKIFVPPVLNIETIDVVTILGNLLDNAFEAVSKVEYKMIRLTVEADKGNLFIKMENTFDGKVKYTAREDGATQIITTNKKVDDHGYGLKNIRRSVEKYDGHMDVSHDDNVFSVGILLYVDDK